MTRQTASEVSEFGELKAGGRLVLEAFEWLRLRRLFNGLAGPMVRLHGYRNTRTRYFRHALCELDCAESPAAGIDPACRTCASS